MMGDSTSPLPIIFARADCFLHQTHIRKQFSGSGQKREVKLGLKLGCWGDDEGMIDRYTV